MFRDRVIDIINNHNVGICPDVLQERLLIASHFLQMSDKPLFLLYTPHVAHCPLQVPKDWLDRYNMVAFSSYCVTWPGS